MAVDEVLRVSEDGLQKGEATESADEGPEVDDVVWLCLRRMNGIPTSESTKVGGVRGDGEVPCLSRQRVPDPSNRNVNE
jgi:hypothetical protein